jgi:hypothetical protein
MRNPPLDAKAAFQFVVSVFCQARHSKEERGGGNLGEEAAHIVDQEELASDRLSALRLTEELRPASS